MPVPTIRKTALRICVNASLIAYEACSGPTSPDCTDQFGRGQTTFNQLNVSCTTVGSNLQCQSVESMTGLYVYCPMQQDVTAFASWTVGDAAVLRSLAPGTFQAVAAGETFVTANWQNLPTQRRPVSVFAGIPLLTYEVDGRVSAGTSPLNGAVIQILDGLVAGRMTISGAAPALLPGYLVSPLPPVAGSFHFLGVPPGTYRVRVTKDGYIGQEQNVSVVSGSPRSLAFELDPAPQ
jgi:hypothetical protein